ncbi:DUF1501 domain-containing protein [Chthonobacter albigriseus]|uniref:DUF1501 domain-containing protein n=1 Tax=Chthonobacter albigriseus TaxID=1683161 RepID=UPI0015EE61CD|nr:DUF1501 domain-containing protein [Chthonobacter albigriseus]
MSEPKLVVVFLRGGIDGLSLVAPSGDADYVAARPPQLRVGRSGDDAGRVLGDAIADADFRFHPQAGGLADLYASGHLAVIHAAGLRHATRSHFEAEGIMERGGAQGATDGWLARFLAETSFDGLMPVLSAGGAAPEMLSGAGNTLVTPSLEAIRLAPWIAGRDKVIARLGAQLAGHPDFGPPVARLIRLSEAIERKIPIREDGQLTPYAPDPRAAYPDSELARNLKSIAWAMKLDLGLRVATVDAGGWDTHFDQARLFPMLTADLSASLSAFWTDLGAHAEETVVVVMSEFGRRLRANTGGGTDHGHGNVMLVLGGPVRGGRMFGRWPGLSNDALDQGADLAITTDYRQVLAEVLATHMRHTVSERIFPGFREPSLDVFGAA